MRPFVTLLLPLLIGVLTPAAMAQTQKHPRVVELEKELARQGLEMLKGRFPGQPFMLTVNIDPLMRERRGQGERGEKLPAYDNIDEEIVDEWDDPALPGSALLSRVRKIQVIASIPANLSEDEVAELKSSLYTGLSLIEARDGIEIRKRNWSALSLDEKNAYMQWGLWAFGALVFFGGLYGLAWFSTDRLSRSYREAAAMSKGGSAAPAAVAPVAADNGDRKNGSAPAGGDLRFNDPIRTREMLASAIRLLEEHRTFPGLEDMIILDRFARQEPARMGALLSEFSFATRQKIFSYSSSQEWLTALSEPGEVSLAAVDVLNRCLRVQRNDLEKDWQELLVTVWRLEGRITEFLTGLSTKESFPILTSLPKMISLPAAREAYPGNWAALLDANATFERPSADRIEALKKRALDLVPLRDDKAVERFRRERELLSFLKVADPATEKEIYTTAGKDSFLQSLRPPFFAVFECGPEALDALAPRVRVDEWAKALFNTNRAERREIEKRLGDKQRVRYFELLKSFDIETPPKERIGDCREHIGRLVAQVTLELKAAAEKPAPESVEEAA